MSSTDELPRFHDTKIGLLREAELSLPPGTSLLPPEMIAEAERKARVWVLAHMLRAGASNVDMQDELGLSLPMLHALRRDPEVLAVMQQLRVDADKAVQDALAAAALRRIDKLELLADDTNVGAEHRVKAGLGLISAYQTGAEREAKKGAGGGTNIAIILQQAGEKMREVPVVELEDIRKGR